AMQSSRSAMVRGRRKSRSVSNVGSKAVSPVKEKSSTGGEAFSIQGLPVKAIKWLILPRLRPYCGP
ncbi:hypothetical protein, partial [Klebsiella aerogenes]|uniref:hypothetical protein n=1 Tax=Klebsiella aerogenes TaxID=548 RepID=UPI001954BE93